MSGVCLDEIEPIGVSLVLLGALPAAPLVLQVRFQVQAFQRRPTTDFPSRCGGDDGKAAANRAVMAATSPFWRKA